MRYNESMKAYNQDDVKLLKKAKKRVMGACILAFLILLFFTGACYYLLTLPFWSSPDSFDMMFAGASVISGLVWIVTIMVIETGKPFSKTVYYTALCLQALFSVWLFYQAWLSVQTGSGLIQNILWGCLNLLECWMLFRFGSWLYTSYYGKIFFYRTLTVYDDEPVQGFNDWPAAAGPSVSSSFGRSAPDFGSSSLYGQEYEPDDEPEYEKRKKVWTSKEAAFLLGGVVLVEMIVFPAFCEIFDSLFTSADGKYSFATSGMFTLCIISAVIWMIPVFFLYLRQSGTKALILMAAGAEILVSIWYSTVLKRYGANPEIVYKWHVFAWFSALDLIRYLILGWAAVKAYQVPSFNGVSGFSLRSLQADDDSSFPDEYEVVAESVDEAEEEETPKPAPAAIPPARPAAAPAAESSRKEEPGPAGEENPWDSEMHPDVIQIVDDSHSGQPESSAPETGIETSQSQAPVQKTENTGTPSRLRRSDRKKEQPAREPVQDLVLTFDDLVSGPDSDNEK